MALDAEPGILLTYTNNTQQSRGERLGQLLALKVLHRSRSA